MFVDLYNIRWGFLGALAVLFFLVHPAKCFSHTVTLAKKVPELPFLLAWCLVSSLASEYCSSSLLTTLTWVAGFFVLWVGMPSAEPPDRNLPRYVLSIYCAAAIPLLAINLILLLQSPSYLFLQRLRFIGTMTTSQHLAMPLIPVCLVGLAYAEEQRHTFRRIAFICVTVTAFLVMFATNARGSWGWLCL